MTSNVKMGNSTDTLSVTDANADTESLNPPLRKSDPPPSYKEPPEDAACCEFKERPSIECGNPATDEYYSGLQWVKVCARHRDGLRDAFAQMGDVLTERKL